MVLFSELFIVFAGELATKGSTIDIQSAVVICLNKCCKIKEQF